jgi:ribonuclease-3
VTDSPPTGPRPTGSREYDELEAVLEHPFEDEALLRAALTHSSYANEHPEDPTPTYERLEFLGDAVLGMVVAEELYHRFDALPEGRLTEWRALLVCGPTLARVARERLDLGRWLRLGRGEETTGGRERETNLERGYEAVVGALYLDRGLEAARAFVERTLGPEIEAMEEAEALNPKGALQQLAQGMSERPEYRVTSQEGPEHDRRFTVEVRVAGEVLGQGSGTSKQQAEKEAARLALDALRARTSTAGDGEAAGSAPGGETSGGA